MSDTRGFWQERKDLAEKMYKLGLVTRLKSGKAEIEKEYKAYDKKGNVGYESALKNLKEEVTALSTYPLKFDLDLGKQLDKADKLYKASNPDPAQEKERKEVAAAAQVTVGHYIRLVKQKQKQLDAVDSQVADVLLTALTKLSGMLDTQRKTDQGTVKYQLDDVMDLAKNWKEAKDKSEKAHKGLVKEPKAVLLLKAAKLGTGYPLTFNKSLSKALETFLKDAAGFKSSTSDSAMEAVRVGKAYQELVRISRKKYEGCLESGFSPKLRDIYDPLEESLESVVTRVERAAVPVKMM